MDLQRRIALVDVAERAQRRRHDAFALLSEQRGIIERRGETRVGAECFHQRGVGADLIEIGVPVANRVTHARDGCVGVAQLEPHAGGVVEDRGEPRRIRQAAFEVAPCSLGHHAEVMIVIHHRVERVLIEGAVVVSRHQREEVVEAQRVGERALAEPSVGEHAQYFDQSVRRELRVGGRRHEPETLFVGQCEHAAQVLLALGVDGPAVPRVGEHLAVAERHANRFGRAPDHLLTHWVEGSAPARISYFGRDVHSSRSPCATGRAASARTEGTRIEVQQPSALVRSRLTGRRGRFIVVPCSRARFLT